MSTSNWNGINGDVDDGDTVEAKLTESFNNIDGMIDSSVHGNLKLKALIDAPTATLEAEGHLPAVVLKVENGGVASTLETTYDNGSQVHAVSTIQWLASQNEADWTLSNKDTGVTETMFRILNGGRASIGTALLQKEIAVVNTARYTDALGDGVLDGLVATGIYIVDDTALPSEISGQAVVKVIKHNTSAFVSQQASDYAGDKDNLMFRSSADGGANWTVWTNKSGAIAAFNIQDANTADINTLRTEGRYTVGSGSTNRPPHTQYGVVEVSTDELNNEMYQVFQSGDSFKSYERHSDGASSWDAWEETHISSDLGFVTYNMTKKADKTSLPTIFSGEVEPSNTLGKDLDWYHRFEAGQSTVTELYAGVSIQSYHPSGFFIMNIQYGDAIEVYPSDHSVFIDIVDNSTLPAEGVILTLDGNDIPLTIISNGAGSMIATYSQTWDAVMENITTSTTYKLTATVGVQTDKEYDYQKHNGEWHKVDFLNVDEINELIRSYDVTIEMNTGHNVPTKTECINAFEQLPHADYTKDDSFHIMSTNKDRMNFVKYLADGSTDADNYTVGLFFVQELSLAT